MFLCARAFASLFNDTTVWASCVVCPCRRMHQGVDQADLLEVVA